MYFQIKELILWPRTSGKPRRVPFETGKVNVISGASKTGKSAIIPIIDYCLGSDRCSIPVGVIRQACAWFGVIVETAEGEKLFARREPGDQKQTENMYVLEGSEVDVPDRIMRHNSDTAAVKATLNRLAGIPNIGFDPESSSGYKSRASIRDLMAFLFQPQNVVANPDVFFFKADTAEHREKLRTIFPYVLGALTPEMLVARWELDALLKKLRAKERELAAVTQVSVRWQMEANSWLDRARELGLLPADRGLPSDWSGTLDLLRSTADLSFRDALPTPAGLSQALADMLHLAEEERQASLELFENRQRLKELEKLKESASAYGGALSIQRERLALSDWLRSLAQPVSASPLSGAALDSSADLDRLCRALENIEADFRSQPAASETIDDELLRLRANVASAAERHEAIRNRIKSHEEAEASRDPFSISDVERYIGGLRQAISTYETIGVDSDLADHVQVLRDRVAKLQTSLSDAKINSAINRAIDSIQTISATIIPKLDAEWPDKPIRLSIQDLSVRVVSQNREDSLWEIGSGANWLAYHVAVTAALQRFFLQNSQSPVPHLLVYDQPSQVYFPRRLAGDDAGVAEPAWRDEDILAVRKVFSALADEVRTSKGRLQVIILDHADRDVWGDLKEVHLVDTWRAGKKLVPDEWIASTSQ